MDTSYDDIKLNLQQIIVLTRHETQQKYREALELYESLIRRYPEFAEAEKSTTEGYFPDIKHHNPLLSVYTMKERLEKE